MAVIQISRIQHRRGLEQDFPQLASAELGWSLDTRRLFIGNGTILEGAPTEGVTEILTEYSNILDLAQTYTFKGDTVAGFIIDTGIDKNNPIVRTLQSKLDDIVSVRDFGAVGDGVTDDTAAIQRAMLRPLGAAETANVQSGQQSFRHRAVYFPAGLYKVTSTILIPPYTKVYGEGKTVSRIFGSVTGPIARLCDSFNNVGEDFGQNNNAGVSPYISEYHINSISFWQEETSHTYPTFQIDGGLSIFITEVQFKGTLLDSPDLDGTTDNNYFFDRGDGAAAVYMPNLSFYNSIQNIVFSQCDMFDVNYGIQLDNSIRNCVIRECYFDRSYHNIVIGKYTLDPAYVPQATVIESCHFRFSTREAVWSGDARGVVSCNNFYYSSSVGARSEYGTGSSGPDNYYNLAPAISFNTDGNYSIGDYFDKSFSGTYQQVGTTVTVFPDVDPNIVDAILVNIIITSGTGISGPYLLDTDLTYSADVAQSASGNCIVQYNMMFPDVECNGFSCIVVNYNFGIENNLLVSRQGRKISLPDSLSFTSTGLMLGYTNDPKSNVEVNYSLKHNNECRVGKLRIVNCDGNLSWDDEYNESDDAQFEWSVVAVGSVTGVEITPATPGTGYTASNNVGTTALTGTGTGLTLKVIPYVGGDPTATYTPGNVLLVYIRDPGTGYKVGDTVQIDDGNFDAVVTITHVKEFEIQYTSSVAGNPAELTYNLTYLNS